MKQQQKIKSKNIWENFVKIKRNREKFLDPAPKKKIDLKPSMNKTVFC